MFTNKLDFHTDAVSVWQPEDAITSKDDADEHDGTGFDQMDDYVAKTLHHQVEYAPCIIQFADQIAMNAYMAEHPDIEFEVVS